MKDKKNSLSHKIVCGISIGMVCSTLLIGGKVVYASSELPQYNFSFDYGNTDET